MKRLSSRIHCARSIRASITEHVVFPSTAKLMNVNVWKASQATDAISTSMIARLNNARTMEFALMALLDSNAIAAELVIPETFVTKTLTNVPEIRVKTTVSASITMEVTPASVVQASVATIVNKLSMNVNHRRVFTVALASRRKKVTLGAFVEMVFRDSFVKVHLNVLITVPMIRNVWMVGVFASKA